MISHEGASHEPYFWRLLLIDTPDFMYPPVDRHIVTKHLNSYEVLTAGSVLKKSRPWLNSLLFGCAAEINHKSDPLLRLPMMNCNGKISPQHMIPNKANN